jgi:heat shock protein HslJ
MDAEYDPDILQDSDTDDEGSPARESQKKGLYFYFAFILLGCLVFLVIFVNIPAMKASAGTMMTKTVWQLQLYTDAGGGLVPAGSPDITARFGRDGQLTGFAGCNEYTATYTTDNYAIRINPPATTMKQCPGPGVMERETAYLANLNATTEFRVTGTALKLYNKTGNPVLAYRAGTS